MPSIPASAWTPRAFMRLPRTQALLYNAALWLLKHTGAWKYPIPANGDYEHMNLRDVLYWLHKAEHHIVQPERGNNLKDYFDIQRNFRWSLPDDFAVGRELSISAVGDLMDHEYLPRSRTLYRNVEEEIFGADLSMANLECVVLDRPPEAPRFDGKTAPQLCVTPCVLDVLTSYQGKCYDFLSTACNHSLDFGVEGVRSTVDALKKRGITCHGTNETVGQAEQARLLERNGVIVAVLSHTFGLNGWHPPSGSPWIVNRTRLNDPPEQLDISLICRQAAHARESGADFVIAQFHWGMEFEHYPRSQQIDVAHTIAENGIDLILGHHPHVIQPFEYYRTRRDPDRVVPIFYSLGNLTNPFRDPRLCRSLVARVSLAKGLTADGISRTYVSTARADTVVQVMDVQARRIELQFSGNTTSMGSE